jgi:hydroxymethylpyrimidine/phosphomethylpyrimidine kinase
MKKVLTIAGSDCSGGAGIQADLKTFSAFGVYGMSAITVVVAENTVGVQVVFDIPVDMVVAQIRSCITDIGADAVKIGMLSSPEIVSAVADCIREYNLPNVVVDPVMFAKNGAALLVEEARQVLKEKLLPLATVITPNLYEAEVLLGKKIVTIAEMKAAAAELRKIGCRWVVVKGGHLIGEREAVDVVFDGKEFHLLNAPFHNTNNTHGTGCTFSSAITAGLAKGYDVLKSIQTAKAYIDQAIQHSLSIGHGQGPTNHLVGVKSRW